jgi:hypothetical protein
VNFNLQFPIFANCLINRKDHLDDFGGGPQEPGGGAGGVRPAAMGRTKEPKINVKRMTKSELDKMHEKFADLDTAVRAHCQKCSSAPHKPRPPRPMSQATHRP